MHAETVLRQLHVVNAMQVLIHFGPAKPQRHSLTSSSTGGPTSVIAPGTFSPASAPAGIHPQLPVPAAAAAGSSAGRMSGSSVNGVTGSFSAGRGARGSVGSSSRSSACSPPPPPSRSLHSKAGKRNSSAKVGDSDKSSSSLGSGNNANKNKSRHNKRRDQSSRDPSAADPNNRDPEMLCWSDRPRCKALRIASPNSRKGSSSSGGGGASPSPHRLCMETSFDSLPRSGDNNSRNKRHTTVAVVNTSAAGPLSPHANGQMSGGMPVSVELADMPDARGNHELRAKLQRLMIPPGSSTPPVLDHHDQRSSTSPWWQRIGESGSISRKLDFPWLSKDDSVYPWIGTAPLASPETLSEVSSIGSRRSFSLRDHGSRGGSFVSSGNGSLRHAIATSSSSRQHSRKPSTASGRAHFETLSAATALQTVYGDPSAKMPVSPRPGAASSAARGAAKFDDEHAPPYFPSSARQHEALGPTASSGSSANSDLGLGLGLGASAAAIRSRGPRQRSSSNNGNSLSESTTTSSSNNNNNDDDDVNNAGNSQCDTLPDVGHDNSLSSDIVHFDVPCTSSVSHHQAVSGGNRVPDEAHFVLHRRQSQVQQNPGAIIGPSAENACLLAFTKDYLQPPSLPKGQGSAQTSGDLSPAEFPSEAVNGDYVHFGAASTSQLRDSSSRALPPPAGVHAHNGASSSAAGSGKLAVYADPFADDCRSEADVDYILLPKQPPPTFQQPSLQTFCRTAVTVGQGERAGPYQTQIVLEQASSPGNGALGLSKKQVTFELAAGSRDPPDRSGSLCRRYKPPPPPREPPEHQRQRHLAATAAPRVGSITTYAAACPFADDEDASPPVTESALPPPDVVPTGRVRIIPVKFVDHPFYDSGRHQNQQLQPGHQQQRPPPTESTL